MNKPLVVVESPTKVKTIKKYLGGQYNVAATVGHIRDLPTKEIGIDIDKNFKPKYTTISGKQKVIRALKKAAGDADLIYLAPDPDREGEAIAWHTAHVLKKKGRQFHRILMHELTPSGIRRAMSQPLKLSLSKYEAQQTRRILDRIVGYEISPLLWRKVRGGLSAGRVQSVAVRIICERERAIFAFEPEEYWSITATLEGSDPPSFDAKLTHKNGQKIKITNGESADEIALSLSGHPFVVDRIVNKTTRRNPLPPFTTSKLQQEAIRKLRFSAKKTMVVAQQLYEGIELGGGAPVGLITYMRTDSMRIAPEAARQALDLIRKTEGPDYAMEKPRFFKNPKKVQDAHEAIRPTAIDRIPGNLARHLSKDQLALYTLIWKRFVASQMKPALIDQQTVKINCSDCQFSVSGSNVRFPGFMKLYQAFNENNAQKKNQTVLPPLEKGQMLTLKKLLPKQHFTQPPPRFSEASLVKELEENGIGRPSTYATILSTIQNKGYVTREKGYFRPSELGFIVNDLIVQNFPEEFDVAFTARMEDNLDKIEAAEIDHLKVLKTFYNGFQKRLEAAIDGMRSMKGQGMPTGIDCPLCKAHQLSVKMGKNGHFLACDGYPACSYTSDYTRDGKGVIIPEVQVQEESSDKTCPRCESPMVYKSGRYGRFLACTGYPECKYTESVSGGNGKGPLIGVPCPEDGGKGDLMERTSKRGKTFFGCSRYPKCKFASWDRPVAHSCPDCGSPYLLEKVRKKTGTSWVCPNRGCGFWQSPACDPSAK